MWGISTVGRTKETFLIPNRAKPQKQLMVNLHKIRREYLGH